MVYKAKTQAQTLTSGSACRQKRKCSFYAILLKNGISHIHAKFTSNCKPFVGIGSYIVTIFSLSPWHIRPKYSWKKYRNSIILKAQSTQKQESLCTHKFCSMVPLMTVGPPQKHLYCLPSGMVFIVLFITRPFLLSFPKFKVFSLESHSQLLLKLQVCVSLTAMIVPWKICNHVRRRGFLLENSLQPPKSTRSQNMSAMFVYMI